MNQSFDFYDKPGYLQELTRAANQAGAGDDLTYMAMGFDVSIPAIAEMTDALCGAASRGATVKLIVDAYCFMFDDKEKLGTMVTKGKIIPEQLSGSFRQTYEKLEQLKSAGGSYYITNKPSRAYKFPYAGRSHIKLAIINDRFFIGGCNFDSARYLDIMVAWRNAPTVKALNGIIEQITTHKTVREALEYTDQTLVLGEQMKLFIDCGVKRQSTILRQAHDIIDEAKENITITCQYFPGRETAQRLLAAHKRGVKVKIYFSHPSVHGPLFFVHHMYNFREKFSLPRSFFDYQLAKEVPKLHSKVIVTESAVMIGSHNYVLDGVRYGTAEIALLNRDPTFIKTMAAKVEELVAGHRLNRKKPTN